MGKWHLRLSPRDRACVLWVALCFGLTSAVYLSWLNRLVALTSGTTADWLSMVAGYLCQAAGLGTSAWLLRRRPNQPHTRAFAACMALFAAATVPALITESAAAVIAFGLLMNLFCGGIAGAYLYAIARHAGPDRRALAFGGGYAIATVAVGLLALIGRGSLLHGEGALLIYLPLCALAVFLAARLKLPEGAGDDGSRKQADGEGTPWLGLACGVVVLISAVKNMGFGFPSADIEAGLVPELSRLPYALGLLAAGVITEKNRRHGMVCTLAALILPFVMLGLTGEQVSATICWGLDYLFYGFFSVFRVALLMDIAVRTRRWALAPLGLMMGRLGDVLGTACALLLGGNRIALIAATTLLFLPTVALLLKLQQKLYEPQAAQARSEQEVFEAFCLHNDLSAREREVLRMVIDNRSNGEIAEALFITESTVKYHVRNVLQKAGCKNRSELQKKYTLALYPQLGEAKGVE